VAFSLVNTVQVGTDPVTGTITLALGTLSAGNGVIVGVSMLDSTTVTVSSVTCGGESLTSTAAITRVTTGSGCAGSVQFWYLSGVTTGGSKTVTVTLSTATSTTDAFAFAVDGSISFDTGTDQLATGSGTSQSVSLTTSAANAIIVAVGLSGYANGDLTEGGAYTAIALTNWDGNFHGEYDLDAGAAGSKTADMSTAGSGPWAIKAAAFKSAGPAAYTLPLDAGSFTLTGGDVQLTENLGASEDVGGLLVGSATSFIGEGYVGANEAVGGSPYTLTLDAGSFTLTGGAVGLRAARTLSASAGSFALTGSAVGLRADRRLALSVGSFTLTGPDVTLTYTPAGADPVLTCDAGSFSLTGGTVGLKQGYVLPIAAGSFALTGSDAARDLSMSLAAGSFTLTGPDVTLTYTPAGANPVLTADAGSFTLTGGDVGLRAARTLALAAGSFTLTGQPTTLLTAHTLALSAGAFTLTGQDITLTPNVAARLTAEAGVFTLTGGDITLIAPSASAQAAVGGLGGGGSIDRRVRRKLDRKLNKILDDVVVEVVYKDLVTTDKAKAAAKVVKPFVETKAESVPEPAAVDWDALTRNAKAVGELLQMWRAIERQREIEADDEDWMMF